MKYIVLEQDLDGLKRKIPIIFPNGLTHKLVADAVLTNQELGGAKVVSAGEFSSMCISAECAGSSDSLNLESDLGDSALITMIDYTHGLT